MASYGVASYCAALGQFLDELDSLVDEQYGNPTSEAPSAPEPASLAYSPPLRRNPAFQACATRNTTAAMATTGVCSGPPCIQIAVSTARSGMDTVRAPASGAHQRRQTVRHTPESPEGDWLDVLLRAADLMDGLAQIPDSDWACGRASTRGGGAAGSGSIPVPTGAVQVTVLLSSSASPSSWLGPAAFDCSVAVATAAAVKSYGAVAAPAAAAGAAGDAPLTAATAAAAVSASNDGGGGGAGDSHYRWVPTASGRNQQLLEMLGLPKGQSVRRQLLYSQDPYEQYDTHVQGCFAPSLEVVDAEDAAMLPVAAGGRCTPPFPSLIPPHGAFPAAGQRLAGPIETEAAAYATSLLRTGVPDDGRAARKEDALAWLYTWPATGGGVVAPAAMAPSPPFRQGREVEVEVEVVCLTTGCGGRGSGGGLLSPYTADWLADTLVWDSFDVTSTGTEGPDTAMSDMYGSLLDPYDRGAHVYVYDMLGAAAPVLAGSPGAVGADDDSTDCERGCGRWCCLGGRGQGPWREL